MNLRKFAKDQNCTVRLPGCLHVPETVVLAHIRRAHVAGMGKKPPDLCGCYACAACHDVIDGRTKLANVNRIELDQYILYALLRTLVIVSEKVDAWVI